MTDVAIDLICLISMGTIAISCELLITRSVTNSFFSCAIDPIILPDVKYEPSLNKASVETWGFKFSDTSVLNFQCVVELCKKALGECNGLTVSQVKSNPL